MDARLDEQINLVNRLQGDLSSGKSEPEVPFDSGKFKIDGTLRENPAFPSGLKAVIAAAALMSTPKQAAEAFNCSAGYASELARGNGSHVIDLNKREDANAKLRQDIYDALGTIRSDAQSRLLKVLGLIDEENLGKIPDKDKARIAATMANQLAGVIDKTIEKSAHVADSRSAHLHLYSPQQRETAEYKKVTIASKVPIDNVIDVEPNGNATD